MPNYSATPLEMVASFWRHRSLIKTLTQREVLGRYRGSVVGMAWSLFNPILMLAIYTFVFSVVFNARWGSGPDTGAGTGTGSKTEFALVLFAGLLVFNLFAECISRAPGHILNNVNYVKKVVFPLEVLPWITMGSALFHFLISLGVWLVAYLLFFGVPHATVLLLPLIGVPLVLLVMGLSWALASLGVYLRDVGQFIGVLITVLMFMSPIFYPASALPQRFQNAMYLNPLTPAIEMARDVMVWGKMPSWWLLALYIAASAGLAWLGFAWFQKTRKGFADVL